MNLFKPLKLDLSPVDKPKVLKPEVLLHMPIPLALVGWNPRLLLGEAWWNRTRKAAYKLNGGFCLACGGSGQLDAHEQYDMDFVKCISVFKDVIPLCRGCHQYIHWEALPDVYKVKILERGNGILWEAGLRVEEIKAKLVLGTYDTSHFSIDINTGIITGPVSTSDILQDSYTYETMAGYYSDSWKLDLSVLNTKAAIDLARKHERIIHDGYKSINVNLNKVRD